MLKTLHLEGYFVYCFRYILCIYIWNLGIYIYLYVKFGTWFVPIKCCSKGIP